MQVRRRKRQRGMSVSINQCYICKEVKICAYELLNVQKDPVCEDCVKKGREQNATN